MAQQLLARGATRAARLAAYRSTSVPALSLTRALVADTHVAGSLLTSVKSVLPVARGVGLQSRNIMVASGSAASGATAAKEVAFWPSSFPAVEVSSAGVVSWQGDLLLLLVTEEDFTTDKEETTLASASPLASLDVAMMGALADIVSTGGFDGKQGTTSRIVRVGSAPGTKAKYVGMIGLGKAAKATASPEWGVSAYQQAGAAAALAAKTARATTAALAFVSAAPSGLSNDTAKATALGQLATGALLAGYESTRFKTKPSPTASKLSALHILGTAQPGWDLSATSAGVEAALAKAQAVAVGATHTKYLVEAPPNVCTPTHLAEAATAIAAAAPDVFTCAVYDKAECEAMGMGLFLGVAEASAEPLKFIHLAYKPTGGASRKVGIVGKGLTFDSGGYNIKAGPGSMIELMKFDMGGSAATLGAARVLASLKPADVEVHFIVAACENMVAGHGLRPGDILTSASGKTVEVNNTDAEGRLTLADALWFAQEKCGVEAVVDVATLTGAIIIALGTEVAGMFTPSDKMASWLTDASKITGDKIWRMPMENNYFDQLKSTVADMKNTGTRNGGAITAALFLKQFIKDNVEWAHLDIAGTAWDDKSALPTGYGAALLAEWAIAQAKAAPAAPSS